MSVSRASGHNIVRVHSVNECYDCPVYVLRIGRHEHRMPDDDHGGDDDDDDDYWLIQT